MKHSPIDMSNKLIQSDPYYQDQSQISEETMSSVGALPNVKMNTINDIVHITI